MGMTPMRAALAVLLASACAGKGGGGGCQCQRDMEGDLLQQTEARAEESEPLGVQEVLDAMGIDDVCDSRVVKVTLGGLSRSGCKVDGLTAYVVWYSYPDYGAAVATEVYFQETEVCGYDIGGIDAGDGVVMDEAEFYEAPDADPSSSRLAVGDGLSPDFLASRTGDGYGLVFDRPGTTRARTAEIEASDDALILREVAMAADDEGGGLGIIGDVAPGQSFEVIDGELYELVESDDDDADATWPGYDHDLLTEIVDGALAPSAHANLPGCN